FAQQAWVPANETECRIEGWSKETHQPGLPVRSSAGIDAQVIGTLPAYVINFDSHNFGIEFQIIGSHQGWLKIRGAKDDPDRSRLPLRATYPGIGWIPGESTAFMVQSGSGHLRPDAGSPKLLDLKGDWLTSMGRIEQVIACDGEWVLLDYSLAKQRNPQTLALKRLTETERQTTRGRAWFRGVCASQETTCETSWP
ncbi:MAG: SH3 domain-containing protein, partial [Candidatus Thiodiazotropha taylori]